MRRDRWNRSLPVGHVEKDTYLKYAFSLMRSCADTRAVNEVSVEWVQDAAKRFRLVVCRRPPAAPIIYEEIRPCELVMDTSGPVIAVGINGKRAW